jgi:hypothetical protein
MSKKVCYIFCLVNLLGASFSFAGYDYKFMVANLLVALIWATWAMFTPLNIKHNNS